MSKAGQAVGLIFLFCLGLAAIFWPNLRSAYDSFVAPPFSVADAKCAKYWISRAQNDPALACYFTENSARLCNRSELKHLAWLMSRYDSDKTAFGQDMLSAIAAVQINTIAEQTSNPNGDSMESLNKAEKKVADSLRSNGVKEAMSVDILPHRELVAKLRVLGEQGYITLDDFGWFPDSLVTEALQGVNARKSSCPAP